MSNEMNEEEQIQKLMEAMSDHPNAQIVNAVINAGNMAFFESVLSYLMIRVFMNHKNPEGVVKMLSEGIDSQLDEALMHVGSMVATDLSDTGVINAIRNGKELIMSSNKMRFAKMIDSAKYFKENSDGEV